MATNTRLVTFNAQNVTPQDDALLYETAIHGSGIIYGANLTANGVNTVHIETGFGIVRGRFFEIFESDIAIPLSASGEIQGRIIGRLDLSNIDEPFVIEAQTGTLAPLRQDADVNIFNGVHEFLLATFLVNELTISSFQDVKPKAESIDLSAYALKHSPILTGVPEAPTNPDYLDKSNQIATTEFVQRMFRERIASDYFYTINNVAVPNGVSTSALFGGTATKEGFYLGTISVRWDANANGYRMLQVERKRGTNFITLGAYDTRMAVNGNDTYQTISVVAPMAVGDEIGVRVFQNSGSQRTMKYVSSRLMGIYFEP